MSFISGVIQMSEIEAMQYRADALVERLRGGTFAELMVKHREDHGLWGLADSFIE